MLSIKTMFDKYNYSYIIRCNGDKTIDARLIPEGTSQTVYEITITSSRPFNIDKAKIIVTTEDLTTHKVDCHKSKDEWLINTFREIIEDYNKQTKGKRTCF